MIDGVNIRALLLRSDGTRETFLGSNIVTNAGVEFYAEQAARFPSGAPNITNNFYGSAGRMILRTGTVTTPAATDTLGQVSGRLADSNKAYTVSFENQDSVANAGDEQNAITYQTTYDPDDFNETTIRGGAIHIGGDSPNNGSILMAHWNFINPATNTPITISKTSSDSLIVYVNHKFGSV